MNIVKLTDLVSNGSKIRKTVDPKVVLQKGDYPVRLGLRALVQLQFLDLCGKCGVSNHLTGAAFYIYNDEYIQN